MLAALVLACSAAVGAAAALPPIQDVLAQARQLATSGQRAAAVTLLQERLTAAPDDFDARTLLGIVLSWEGRYADARLELRRVLAERPEYGDALAALTHVELWDGQPALAVTLADATLRLRPDDTTVMLAKARALYALNRSREAIDTLDRLLIIDSSHAQARALKSQWMDSQRSWAVGAGYSYDGFSDGRTPWREEWLALRRRADFGSITATASRVDRYGESDAQFEVEAYPRLRPGTYMYLDGGWSPDAVWYPSYRIGAHLYQSMGRGFEGSIGMSRLGFGSGINIYIGSLAKYVGRWMLIGQVFITPKDIGTNASYHAAFRYYFRDAQYFGLRYHHGAANERIATLNDVLVLNADGLAGETVFVLGRRSEFNLRGAWEDQQRYQQDHLKQYTASARLFVKF
jgi:YaiO family outer membrane protein